MGKFIFNLILWALALGTAGTLTDITLSLGKAAAKEHQTGLISLKKLNDSLNGR